jgi:hypothetical protein
VFKNLCHILKSFLKIWDITGGARAPLCAGGLTEAQPEGYF